VAPERVRRRRLSVALLAASAVALSAGADMANALPTPVSVECVPAPANCGGWYRGPVTVKWQLPLATDTLPGTCVLRTLQADTAGTKQSCTAWQVDKLTGMSTVDVVIKIDATPPTVSAVPDRPPDHAGWFNHPVGVRFQGSDATSGVASCDAGSYGGPEAVGAVVAGSCRDVAGNVGAGSLALNYDATAPAAPQVAARPGNGTVELDWSVAPDAEAVEVTRLAHAAGPPAVFDGGAHRFTDRRLRNQARYRYAITAVDRAGNRAQTVVSAVPTASKLLTPALGARLAAAPLLQWKPVKRAAYYNVQLFRGKRKLLSRWPTAAQLQLDGSWRFDGQRRRLASGRYRWFVWPGYGKRAERRYGRRLGASAFTVVR
jgi:hypothetical protein